MYVCIACIYVCTIVGLCICICTHISMYARCTHDAAPLNTKHHMTVTLMSVTIGLLEYCVL